MNYIDNIVIDNDVPSRFIPSARFVTFPQNQKNSFFHRKIVGVFHSFRLKNIDNRVIDNDVSLNLSLTKGPCTTGVKILTAPAEPSGLLNPSFVQRSEILSGCFPHPLCQIREGMSIAQYLK